MYKLSDMANWNVNSTVNTDEKEGGEKHQEICIFILNGIIHYIYSCVFATGDGYDNRIYPIPPKQFPDALIRFQ